MSGRAGRRARRQARAGVSGAGLRAETTCECGSRFTYTQNDVQQEEHYTWIGEAGWTEVFVICRRCRRRCRP